MIAQVRRSTELGLIVLAAIITAGAYALAALGRTSTLPANLAPFLVVILALLIAAHLAHAHVRPRRRRHAPPAGRAPQRARLRDDRPGRHRPGRAAGHVDVRGHRRLRGHPPRRPPRPRPGPLQVDVRALRDRAAHAPVRARPRLRGARRRPPVGEPRPDQLPARRVRQDRPRPVLRRLPHRAARAPGRRHVEGRALPPPRAAPPRPAPHRLGGLAGRDDRPEGPRLVAPLLRPVRRPPLGRPRSA